MNSFHFVDFEMRNICKFGMHVVYESLEMSVVHIGFNISFLRETYITQYSVVRATFSRILWCSVYSPRTLISDKPHYTGNLAHFLFSPSKTKNSL